MSAFEDYLTALEAGDAELVTRAVGPDTVLRVAVHTEPFPGREAIGFIFGQLFSGIFSDLHILEVLADGGRRVARFDVGIVGYEGRAEGLNYIVLHDDGGLDEIIVFLRPLDALQALSDEMGRLGGPRPG